MSAVDRIAQAIARIPTVRSETATFVGMDGASAQILVDQNLVTLPCAGWYPPAVGMTVQVEWRDGRGIVTGPARAISPVGTITATGTPKATVTIDGTEYVLYVRDGYSPVVGDLVTVSWASGSIEGKISGQDTPQAPEVPPPAKTPFTDLVVRAADSGRYQSYWWGNDPWASSSNDGSWFYESRLRDALRDADVTGVEIYLPLISEVGQAQIGTHPHPTRPGGGPALGDFQPLPPGSRSGWVRLPDWWGPWFRDHDGGVGVRAPGGDGFTQWRGTAADGLSGALRFAGTR